MYSIYADGVCIYDGAHPSERLSVISPTLTLEDNCAGSLKMSLPVTNLAYNMIERLKTEIVVKKNGDEIWSGRVLSGKKDFFNNHQFVCEGELAYLNDTTQPQAEYHGLTVREFLEVLIDNHNLKVDAHHMFVVGIVTVTDDNDYLYRYTNYESTLECINEKLLKRLGGHIRIRKESGIRYIDYLEDYPNTATQSVQFGKNLVDFTRSWDSSEFATVILPLGERLEGEGTEIGNLETYLTVESVNDGSPYVAMESIYEFGWIEKVVHWDDVSVPSNLLRKAQQYLSDVQFDNIELEVKAFDLSLMGVDYESFNLLDRVRVVSPPHGMDRYFPISKMSIPLDNPSNMTFVMNKSERPSYTSASNKTNQEILQKIQNLPSETSILEKAQNNATQIIRNFTNGYVSLIVKENGTSELIISDNIDYEHSSRLWRWNIDGLGYSSDGGLTYNLAMTMDGSIVADMITTGNLNANLITSGRIQDKTGINFFDLDTGEINFSTINKAITDQGDVLSGRIDDIGHYLRFANGVITLGEVGNPISLEIRNNRIAFMSGDDEVAYISDKVLYITDATFLNSINIGNWAFLPRESGNLSFKKVR